MKHPCFCLRTGTMIFKKLFSVLFLSVGFVAFGNIWGQIGMSEIKGARNKGLGDVGVALGGLEGYIYNSSALGQLRKSSILLNAENRFQGTGIRGYSLGAALPVGKNGCFGGTIEHYGLPEYHQRHYRTGFGLALTQKVSIGTSFGVKTYSIAAYPPGLSLNIDLGLTYHITDLITLGWSGFQPFYNSINTIPETPVHIFGVKYKASEPIRLSIQFEKEKKLNWVIKYAMEYWVVPQFGVRIGLARGATVLNAGFGLKVNPQLFIDGAFSIHSALGITPALSLHYQFKPNQDPEEKL